MLTQIIVSVSLFLIFMLECARLYLGVQGNLNEKVKYKILFRYNLYDDVTIPYLKLLAQ